MTDHDKDITDKEFDDYLSGDSDISALYQTDDSALSDELKSVSFDIDNAILAAAKREINARPVSLHKSYSPFSNNYFMVFSTAASIVIVVALVSFFPEQPVSVVESYPQVEAPVVAELEQQPQKKIRQQSVVKAGVEKSNIKKELTRKRKVKPKEKLFDQLSANDITTEKKKQTTDSESFISQSTNMRHLFSLNSQDDLQFDEKKWRKLSEQEWRKRIKKIYQLRGESAVKVIVDAFNKKFKNDNSKNNKLSIKEIIMNSKN
ncbi:hypothetical protein MNBD_GAMMA22-1125 [hydrothermal vent metagenome]|uniref:Uncharacterized protein n=1 Tax=hydrothermal vent metagenome TaxID=652676 RepID=A0A3B1APD2_9ZZZZ